MTQKKEDRKTHIDKLVPKPHIRQCDFAGLEPILTIKNFDWRKVHQPGKHQEVEVGVLFFKETPKYLILNETRKDQLKESFGEYADDLIGEKIQLYIDPKIKAFGEEVDGIRLRQAPKKTADQNILELGFPEEKKIWKEDHIQIVLEYTYYDASEEVIELLNDSGLDPKKVSNERVEKFARYFQGEIDQGSTRENALLIPGTK
jgi:hypothetical protein